MPRFLRALLLLATAGAVFAANAGRSSSPRVATRPKQAAPQAPDVQLVPLAMGLPDIT